MKVRCRVCTSEVPCALHRFGNAEVHGSEDECCGVGYRKTGGRKPEMIPCQGKVEQKGKIPILGRTYFLCGYHARVFKDYLPEIEMERA